MAEEMLIHSPYRGLKNRTAVFSFENGTADEKRQKEGENSCNDNLAVYISENTCIHWFSIC